MILTLTSNPTIDRVLFVRDFHMQDVVRAEREVAVPSGKGVDVSVVVHELGGETLVMGLNAGHTGALMAQLLADQGIAHDFVPAHGETRTAVVLVDMVHGRHSTILASTLTAEPVHLDRLLERVAHHAPRSWGLVCAGSLAPGLPVDAYRRILAEARRLGLVTLLDSSGDGLRHGVAGLPHILKINGRELADLDAGAVVRWQSVDQAVDESGIPGDLCWLAGFLADRLGAWAEQAIAVTLGSRGVMAVTDEGNFYVPSLSVPVVSAAGAGDAVDAGLILARRRGQGWVDALALGMAAAASVVMNEGTAVCRRAQVESLLDQMQMRRIPSVKRET